MPRMEIADRSLKPTGHGLCCNYGCGDKYSNNTVSRAGNKSLFSRVRASETPFCCGQWKIYMPWHSGEEFGKDRMTEEIDMN